MVSLCALWAVLDMGMFPFFLTHHYEDSKIWSPTHPAESNHLAGYDDEDAGEMAIHYLSRGEHFAREGAGKLENFDVEMMSVRCGGCHLEIGSGLIITPGWRFFWSFLKPHIGERMNKMTRVVLLGCFCWYKTFKTHNVHRCRRWPISRGPTMLVVGWSASDASGADAGKVGEGDEVLLSGWSALGSPFTPPHIHDSSHNQDYIGLL